MLAKLLLSYKHKAVIITDLTRKVDKRETDQEPETERLGFAAAEHK